MANNVFAATIPTPPSTVYASIANGNNITISWSSVNGATYYEREVRFGGGWKYLKTYTNTSVTYSNQPARQSQYRVRACNSGGCSAWKASNTVTIINPPASPSSVTASILNGDDIKVSWSSVNGATYYEREVRIIGSYSWGFLKTYTNTSVTYPNQPARQSQYRVRACNSGGCSAWKTSNTVTIINPPVSPSSVTASILNGDDIKVSWSSVSGATSYEREVRIIGLYDWNYLRTYTNTSATYANQPARQSQYRVRACNSGGCSAWKTSNTVTIVTPPAAPSTVGASIANGNDITVSWSSVNGATYYNRQVSVGGSSWGANRVYQAPQTSVSFNDQPAWSTRYRVQACNSGGCSAWETSNTVTIVAPPAAPSTVSASITNGNDITISWSSVSGATYYEREVRIIGLYEWNYLSTHTNTSVTHPNQPARQSQYRARACNNGGCSAWETSNTVTIVAILPAPNTVSASITNGNDITVSWSSVSGATYYEREASLDGGSTWIHNRRYDAPQTSVSFDDSPVRSTQYRVRACSEIDDCSTTWQESNTITIAPPLAAPDTVSAFITNGNDITVSWSSVSGTTYYEREASLDGGSTWIHNRRYDAPQTSVEFNDSPARSTQYRVRACNEVDYCSITWQESNTITIAPPLAAPDTVSASITNGNDITVSWSSVSGTTYYEREASLDGGSTWIHNRRYDAPQTSVSFDDSPARSTQYRVRACNEVDYCSTTWQESNTITIAPPLAAPDTVSASITNDNDITVSWSSVSGATYYEREASLDGGSTWIHNRRYDAPQTSVEFNDSPARSTQYRVRACNEVGYCSTVWTTSNAITIATRINLPPHGDFETGNAMLVRTASQLSFETENPIAGNRSLKVITNGYEPIYYNHTDFNELNRNLSTVTFSGILNTTRNTRLAVSITYTEGGYSGRSHKTEYISDNFNVNQGFSLSVDTDPERDVKSISIFVASTCGSCVDNMTIILDNLSLEAKTPDEVVYKDIAGNLYVKTQSGQYHQLSKNIDGTWSVTTIDKATWDSLTIRSEYTLEFGEFGGGELIDYKLIKGNDEVIIIQTESGKFEAALGRQIIFIHTDLLGSPVAETDLNGVVN